MSKFAGLGLAVDTPFIVQLQHPVSGAALRTASGEEATITLLSGDSQAARAHQNRTLNARLSQRVRGSITAEQLEAEQVELLTTLTQSWVLVDLDGNALDVDCTPQNARDLYAARECRWIREQVEQAIDNRKNVKTA
jgi:hypothetical protein